MTSPSGLRASTLVSARLATYPAATSFGPRNLKHHQFVWLLNGSALWQVDDRPPVALGPGTLVLARPGEVDAYQWDSRTTSTHAYIHFAVEGEAVLPDARDFTSMPVLSALCDHLLDLPDDASLAEHRDQVLTTLLEAYAMGPRAARQQFHPLIELMLGHVRMVWQRDGLCIVPAQELAAVAGVSPGHVFRLFREQFSRGPADVLELVRLSVATTTLRRSDATIAEVAALCGYTNPYHFSRRFSSAVGVAPGAYRRLDHVDAREVVREAGLGEVARLVLDPRAT